MTSTRNQDKSGAEGGASSTIAAASSSAAALSTARENSEILWADPSAFLHLLQSRINLMHCAFCSLFLYMQ